MLWSDITTALIAGTITGLITAYIAYRRERKPILWFCIGFFFGLLGLLFFFFVPRKKKPIPAAPLKPQPQPYVFGPSDKYWYFLDRAQAQVGPMSYTALSNHWKQGEIKPDTFVWHEDLADWKPLQELIRVREAPV
jgi:drug/metabolite transporter (DMT)-like permease